MLSYVIIITLIIICSVFIFIHILRNNETTKGGAYPKDIIESKSNQKGWLSIICCWHVAPESDNKVNYIVCKAGMITDNNTNKHENIYLSRPNINNEPYKFCPETCFGHKRIGMFFATKLPTNYQLFVENPDKSFSRKQKLDKGDIRYAFTYVNDWLGIRETAMHINWMHDTYKTLQKNIEGAWIFSDDGVFCKTDGHLPTCDLGRIVTGKIGREFRGIFGDHDNTSECVMFKLKNDATKDDMLKIVYEKMKSALDDITDRPSDEIFSCIMKSKPNINDSGALRSIVKRYTDKRIHPSIKDDKQDELNKLQVDLEKYNESISSNRST